MTMINEIEARVVGSLVEKQLTTPEYYPLTLNALTAACNQKSNRDPVMSLRDTDVMAAINSLRDKNLVYTFHGSTSRTVKYKHMLANVYELEPPSTAVMTLLLLRGPQTAGEIRGRAERLYEFSSISEVQETLDDLSRKAEPLVVKLERQPGQKEARYAHLLSGPVDTAAVAESYSKPQVSGGGNERLDKLESEVERLSVELDDLKQKFQEFSRQFE